MSRERRRERLRELVERLDVGAVLLRTPASYASREIVASHEIAQEIQAGQVFAWNPSITGAKAEETFILTGNGPEVIT